MSEKKFTPKEAAIAVLKKAEELYKASTLAKGEMPFKDDAKNPDAKADAALGEKVEQDVHQHEESNEDPAAHEKPMKGHIKLAKFVGRMEHKKGEKAKELDKSVSAGSGMPSAETGHEKGINTRVDSRNPISISDAGRDARSANKWSADNKAGIGSKKVTGELAREHKGAAVEHHKEVLSQMQSMPKPKLPG